MTTLIMLAVVLMLSAPVAASAADWVLWEWTYHSTVEQAREGGQSAQLDAHEASGIYPSSPACFQAARTRGREYAADLAQINREDPEARYILTLGRPVESTNPPGVRVEAETQRKHILDRPGEPMHSRFTILWILKTQCWPAGVTPR